MLGLRGGWLVGCVGVLRYVEGFRWMVGGVCTND